MVASKKKGENWVWRSVGSVSPSSAQTFLLEHGQGSREVTSVKWPCWADTGAAGFGEAVVVSRISALGNKKDAGQTWLAAPLPDSYCPWMCGKHSFPI